MSGRLLLAVSCFVGAVIAQVPAAVEATTILEGRVVDMRGDGVPAARVRAVGYDEPTKALAQTVADGDGYFRLAKVPDRRTLQVHADAPGCCTGVEVVGSGRRGILVALQHAVAVRGVLTNRRGEPVPDVVVRADPLGRSLTYVRCDARTDRDGRFELAAVPLAPVQFTAWVPGEGLAEVLQQVTGPLDLTLQPGAMKVTDLSVVIEGLPADAPPVGLSLLPYRDGSHCYLPPPFERPRCDAEGRWQLQGVPDWGYSVSPSSTAFAFAPRDVRVEAGKGPHVLRFTATAIGTTTLACRAVVRDAAGQPVAGLPFRLRAPNGGAVADAISDAEGRLVFASPLAPGAEAVLYTTDEQWVVDQDKGTARHLDRRALTQHEFRVDPATELAVRIVPGCAVTGRVLLADGRPAPFVAVELQESSPNRMPTWMAMSWATTDRDGRFRFTGRHHLADAVRLHVEAREGSFDGEPFHLAEPGAAHAAGDVKLSAPASIDGVLRDAEQRPAPGVRVWLRDWDFVRNGQASGSVVETLTDRDGRYRFVGVPVGGAWLQVLPGVTDRFPRDRAVEPFAVEAGATYTCELQLPAK